MTKKQKKNLKRILIGLSAFIVILLADIIFKHAFSERFPFGLASIIEGSLGWLIPFGLYLAVYLYIGFKVLKKSAINILHGQIFDENFLMSVATIGAFALGIYTGITTGSPEGFDEACAVMLFYMLGEWFESYAVIKSRKSIGALMDIRPDVANLIDNDENITTVDPSTVKVGDIILVRPGEKIPLDGVIISGSSDIDAKALTGESLPVSVKEKDAVLSGTVNLTGAIKIKTTKTFGDSTATKILELVENASEKKSKTENFITRFSKFYTPTVVFAAILLAVVPPIAIGLSGGGYAFSVWIYRALMFLVVSCPCALVISVPLSFFAGIGGASAQGILVKGSVYFEKLNKANIFVFDKTGTLTKGNFSITEVYPEENREEVLYYASIAEKDSVHPIAQSIKAAVSADTASYSYKEIAGRGTIAKGEKEILCGNGKLMEEYGVAYNKVSAVGTVVYVAVDRKFIGYIVISDQVKEETKEVISKLQVGGAKTVMLTGDNERIAKSVADSVGISEYKANLLPQGKAEEVEKMINKKGEKDVLCYVGDGINDAPVLMLSDVGISMGGVGSDAAIEASDVVLIKDDLKTLPLAKSTAKKTMRIVYENIVFAIAVKVIILILSALGITNMWIAVFGDVGVAILAILNAMRASSVGKKNLKKQKIIVDNGKK